MLPPCGGGGRVSEVYAGKKPPDGICPLCSGPMKSFFFGTGRRLYGTLHEAKGTQKSTGVLLCYPGVQEYNMTHWAFRKLAGLITKSGMPVLRFDYSCSGDS